MKYDKFDLAEMAFEDYASETDMNKAMKLYLWQQIEEQMENIETEWDINDFLMRIRRGNLSKNKLARAEFEGYCFETGLNQASKLHHWQQIEKEIEKLEGKDFKDFLIKIRQGTFGRSIGFNWNPPLIEKEKEKEETEVTDEETPGIIWNNDPSHNIQVDSQLGVIKPPGTSIEVEGNFT